MKRKLTNIENLVIMSKKSVLIICAVLGTISLTAFGFINNNHTANTQAAFDLEYDVASRFIRTVTKEDLSKAKSILDIVPEDLKKSIVSYSSVSIIILDDQYNKVITETGDSPELTAAQVKLLQSVDYSTDILIRAEYKEKDRVTGELRESYSTPHLTVVPENQAVNSSGKDELITYIKENTRAFATIVKRDNLQPGKVAFTINKEGKVANASIISTSAYPAFDQKMIDLVSDMPGTWEAATNSKGEKVEQKFVFSFGLIGC